jgi:hypothetical protein
VDSCEQKGKKDGRFEVIIGKSYDGRRQIEVFRPGQQL